MMETPTAAETLPSIPALAIEVLLRLGVTHFVVSPGSRSAPLIAAIAQRSELSTFLVYDERSAGYIALGIAQQRQRPAALVCTSGTAAANYAPAVAEAFYQGVPLILLTADRPAEWIDQQDNQAIRQDGLYARHVLASFTLPMDDGQPVTHWHASRVISDAVQIATGPVQGPVHVNVPLREPLYVQPAVAPVARPAHVPQVARTTTHVVAEELHSLDILWRESRRKLVVGGLHPPDATLELALNRLAQDPSVAIVGDVTANLHAVDGAIRGWEAALGSADPILKSLLRPDLVLSFGGPLTSRALRTLLRASPPTHFWRVAPERPAVDTFQALTLALPLEAAQFLSTLGTSDYASDLFAYDYANTWRTASSHAAARLHALLDDSPWGEFLACRELCSHLPPGSRLQLGNSMPIRYVNLLDASIPAGVARIDSNRGTSGIDGAVSTAVGAALAADSLTTLIVGDLGFFYDRNGLWHSHLPHNLRIVVLNNQGGGIFDLIDGPEQLPAPVRSRYFLTPHSLSARRTSEDHGLAFDAVSDLSALRRILPEFFAPSSVPRLLEVSTDMSTNSEVYRRWRSELRPTFSAG